jgi:hypothetical protein
MKTTKIIYWTTTGIVSLMMCFSAWMYLAKPEIKEAFHLLGFPDYFRVELAVAKLVGAALLVAPVWRRLKEWVYAGFGIVFVSAFVAHLSSGVAVSSGVMALVFLAVTGVSYAAYHRLLAAHMVK